VVRVFCGSFLHRLDTRYAFGLEDLHGVGLKRIVAGVQADRLAGLDFPAMSDDEIEQEIRRARKPTAA
jgi:hypothetical protein